MVKGFAGRKPSVFHNPKQHQRRTTDEKQFRSLVRVAHAAFRYARGVYRDGIVSRWAEHEFVYHRRDGNDVS
jgi:hypothetical protein